MTQKSVRKADTNWTDQDSEDQMCFNCVTVRTVRIGDRVINVECTKQDVIALNAKQLSRVDNDTDLGTKYMERDRIKRCMTKMGMMIVGAWAGEQLPDVSGTGVIIGEDLMRVTVGRIGVMLPSTVVV